MLIRMVCDGNATIAMDKSSTNGSMSIAILDYQRKDLNLIEGDVCQVDITRHLCNETNIHTYTKGLIILCNNWD